MIPPLVAPRTVVTPTPVLPADGSPVLVPQQGVSLSPTQVVAPVGSEVIMIATVINQKGSTLPGERVEWTIAQGGVGQFVSPGQRSALDVVDLLRGLPQKVNNTYVVNSTVTFDTAVDRGTLNPADRVPIRSGQAWVTVSSPVEGSTFVTAFAPAVKGWDQRQQTGSIYWIDAAWTFPAPVIGAAGSRQTLDTTLRRQTDGGPLPGWIVRYEIAGGPDAGFGPDGSPTIEVISNEGGQAPVEIFQKVATTGTNVVNVQVLRPAGMGGPSRRVAVGGGATSATWTGSEVSLRVSGPAQAGVGSIATYRIEVSNPATSAIQNVMVSDQVPPGLLFLNSNPAAGNSPSGQEWQIGDLGPQQTRTIEVNLRVEQPGTFSYCAGATTASGLTAKGCATTTAAGSQFDVAIRGPAAAEVGTDASFTIEVTNRGDAAASGVVVSDRFDAGLQHEAATSPIQADLGQIGPRETRRIAVTFHVVAAGLLCQEVTVTGDAGLRGDARSCLNARDRAAVAPPPQSPPFAAPPTSQPGPPATVPPGAGPPSAGPPAAIEPTTPRAAAAGWRASERSHEWPRAAKARRNSPLCHYRDECRRRFAEERAARRRGRIEPGDCRR